VKELLSQLQANIKIASVMFCFPAAPVGKKHLNAITEKKVKEKKQLKKEEKNRKRR